MKEKTLVTFYPKNRVAWRTWLKKNHASKSSIWLIYYQTKTKQPTISWSDAVEEALCYGWIDSKKKPIDQEKYMQFFSKRKATSTWSKINKNKVEQLIANGKMADAGLKSIAIAKENGSWSILDEVEALIIPNDLTLAFRMYPGSVDFYHNLSKSVKKRILQWIVLAKQDSTRQKRIEEVVEMASKGLNPVQLR